MYYTQMAVIPVHECFIMLEYSRGGRARGGPVHALLHKKLTNENSQTIYLGTDYLTMNSVPSGAELVQSLVVPRGTKCVVVQPTVRVPPPAWVCKRVDLRRVELARFNPRQPLRLCRHAALLTPGIRPLCPVSRLV